MPGDDEPKGLQRWTSLRLIFKIPCRVPHSISVSRGSAANPRQPIGSHVQIFLPIADLPVNIFLILAMGIAVGFVSGMFGIGGGFLMTPLLIFVGIAPAVAVA